jgi:putative nucleotidyltransferase with HDIG domain
MSSMSNSLDFSILLGTLPIELPVFHAIALELQHHLEQPNFSMEKTITLVNEDQSLAGHILKMANSVAYMGLVPIETIKAAVIRLGSRQVCNIAMTVSQSGLHASENEVVHGLMQSLWEHSYSCALGCKWLAENTGNRQYADQAYMAGLLHDIGKLFLLKGMERLNIMGVTQADLEKKLLLEVFEAHHIEQGRRLMRQWNMPDSYCHVVADHHNESFTPGDTVMIIVRFLNAACKVKGLGIEAAIDIPLLELPEALALNLDEEKVHGLLQFLDETKNQEMDISSGFTKADADKRIA